MGRLALAIGAAIAPWLYVRLLAVRPAMEREVVLFGRQTIAGDREQTRIILADH